MNQEKSPFRASREEMLDKQFLIFRQDDLAILIQPVRCMRFYKCAETGEQIAPGEYAYRCHENPVRVARWGTGRVSVNAVIAKLETMFPEATMQIPLYEVVTSHAAIRAATKERRKVLTDIGTELLKAAEVGGV